VPSLALNRQSLGAWTREFLARGITPDWLCVCSDETASKLDRDDFVGETYDLGIPATTDKKEIATFLKRKGTGHRIVFTTYQSSHRLAEAARSVNHSFDLAIFDEAHKTVGVKQKAFATLLFEKNISIKQRLFMTATERVLRGKNDDVLSMDDERTYGRRFFLMTFKEAIDQKVISDYRIITMTVSSDRLQRIIAENRLLNLDPVTLSEAEAQSVAAGRNSASDMQSPSTAAFVRPTSSGSSRTL
jgi:predicted helicase